jgi:hypothetical protein
MTPETLMTLAETTKNLTIAAVLVIIIWGGYKGVWVWGWSHKERVRELLNRVAELETDRDEWKNLAISNMGLLTKSVEQSTALVRSKKPGTRSNDPST